MLVPQLAEHVFVGQSTIGISLFKLETPYADPHVRCCERCDAKTSAYSIYSEACGGRYEKGTEPAGRRPLFFFVCQFLARQSLSGVLKVDGFSKSPLMELRRPSEVKVRKRFFWIGSSQPWRST